MPQPIRAQTPVGPVQGMQAFRVILQPDAPPEVMHGGPVKAMHADPGEQATPYPWQEFAGPHGPYGPAEDELLSDLPESRTFAAGDITQDPSGDQTPYYTHGGPHITGYRMDRGPDGNAEVLRQSYAAHGVRTNASKKGIQGPDVQQDYWTGFFNSVPGDDQVAPVSKQVGYQSAGFGVNDHTSNPMAKVNPYGLANSHRMRRFATGHIPGNWMWMQPGGRPMVKSAAGPARPATGEGPFYGDDITQSFGLQGAVLLDPATEYVAPPSVNVVPATQLYAPPDAIELW